MSRGFIFIPLTAERVRRIGEMWDRGHDTADIAERLGITEEVALHYVGLRRQERRFEQALREEEVAGR